MDTQKNSDSADDADTAPLAKGVHATAAVTAAACVYFVVVVAEVEMIYFADYSRHAEP